MQGDYAEFRGAKRDGLIAGPALGAAIGKRIRPKNFGGSGSAAAMPGSWFKAV